MPLFAVMNGCNSPPPPAPTGPLAPLYGPPMTPLERQYVQQYINMMLAAFQELNQTNGTTGQATPDVAAYVKQLASLRLGADNNYAMTQSQLSSLQSQGGLVGKELMMKMTVKGNTLVRAPQFKTIEAVTVPQSGNWDLSALLIKGWTKAHI